jgi:hypothetical protein
VIFLIKRKIKRVKRKKEDVEMLRIQLKARENEISELRNELDEIHESISYRIGRNIAETRIGSWLKKILKKHIFKS